MRVSVWRFVVSVLTMPVAQARMSAVMRLLPVRWGSVGHIGVPVLPGAGRLTSPRGRCRGEQGDDGECREGDATVHDALPVSALCQFGRQGEQSRRVALNKRTTSRSAAVRLHELFVTYTELVLLDPAGRGEGVSLAAESVENPGVHLVLLLEGRQIARRITGHLIWIDLSHFIRARLR